MVELNSEKELFTYDFLIPWGGKIVEFHCSIEPSEYRKEWKRKIPDIILNIAWLFEV